MDNMFDNALTFNQNLSGWTVYNITSEPSENSPLSSLTNQNKPVWGTCPDFNINLTAILVLITHCHQ